jgi:hypothetical protein
MPATILFTATDLLYLLCSVLLLVSAAAILWRDPRSEPHRHYALTALSLLGWVATLPLYYRSEDPDAVLWLGRINFAAAALAVSFGYLLVRSLAQRRDEHWKEAAVDRQVSAFVTLEALLLALLSAFTGLVDQAELLGMEPGGRHVTVYGILFPLYALHVLAYLGASTLAAFQARKGTVRGAARDRLTLVGAGVLVTGIVGVVADIILPYGFGDFRFTDAGPLSTAAFLIAVGYAVLKHRLFDLRFLVLRTLVLGVLGSLALAAYGAVVVLATERFAGDGAGTFTKFGVLVIALSFDPLRRKLEQKVDRLLFHH